MSDRSTKQIPYKKSHLPSKLLGTTEVYYVLFILYILGYATLQHIFNTSQQDEFANNNYQALVYLFTYSMFVFFLILKAAATYSVYEYYVALFILLQKLVVMTIIVFQNHILGSSLQFAIVITICALNYVEFAYLAFNLYTKRAEINFYLFKLSGVDPSVNSKWKLW